MSGLHPSGSILWSTPYEVPTADVGATARQKFWKELPANDSGGHDSTFISPIPGNNFYHLFSNGGPGSGVGGAGATDILISRLQVDHPDLSSILNGISCYDCFYLPRCASVSPITFQEI